MHDYYTHAFVEITTTIGFKYTCILHARLLSLLIQFSTQTTSSEDQGKYEVADIDKGLESPESTKDSSDKTKETAHENHESDKNATIENKEDSQIKEEEVKTPETSTESADKTVTTTESKEIETKTEAAENKDLTSKDESAIAGQLSATSINDTKSEPQTEIESAKEESTSDPTVEIKPEPEINATSTSTNEQSPANPEHEEDNVKGDEDKEATTDESEVQESKEKNDLQPVDPEEVCI